MEITKDNQNKKRLGRGLGSLLGANEQQQSQSFAQERAGGEGAAGVQQNTENRVWNIAVDKLVPGIYQPRKNFDKELMNELANSIKENGIIQPITVRRRSAGVYEILAGERRWRAAQAAGLHEVPAIIKTLSDREALQVALIENIQREDLGPIEEAESYQRLIDEFSLSQQEAAEKVGKERSSVANAIRLLGLSGEIKEMITKKQISVGHAKALLSVSDKNKQITLAKKASEGAMSVRALETEIKGLQKSANNTKPHQLADPLNIDLAKKLAADLADQLQKALGTKVEINYKVGKGSVEVFFYSDDQLTQIYEKLKN